MKQIQLNKVDIFPDTFVNMPRNTSMDISTTHIRTICSIIFTIIFIATYVFIGPSLIYAAPSERCTPNITSSTGDISTALSDNSYKSIVSLSAGDMLTITSDKPFSGVYVQWDCPVKEWSLLADDDIYLCGLNGFLHEYVKLSKPVTSATINVSYDMSVSEIAVYTEGELPSSVQTWEPPCERADILLYSTHADDEILFFGGILPTYAGELDLRVQVVYFSEYWTGERIREHEKLDGLWTAGVTNYPVTLDFRDVYTSNFDEASTIFGYNDALKETVEFLRRFKPQVAVAQDFEGEYGHGSHMFTAQIMADAVEISADATKFPESAQRYGVWDVPKTYMHLYRENPIVLDCHTPLSAFDGKTCLEVAKEAYLQHISQQWCWFYVSDTYLSCVEYGLYRSTVGQDVLKNDIMENLIPYEIQEKQLREQELKEQEIMEAKKLEMKKAVLKVIEGVYKICHFFVNCNFHS